MNKKKLVTTLGSLALVGAIGVGSTLAFLSDKTNTLKNTFVVGNGIDIILDETDITNPDGPRIQTGGNNYVDLQPGKVQVKDPMTTVKIGSNACYVFMKLEGADEFEGTDVDGDHLGDFEIIGMSSDWSKVRDLEATTNTQNKKNGYYVYKSTVNTVDADEDMKLTKLFTHIKMSEDVKTIVDKKVDGEGNSTMPEIKITSYAIQAETFDSASAALDALLNQLTLQ